MATYEEMKNISRDFYKKLEVEINDEDIAFAVTSLTMPQYAKEKMINVIWG